MTASSSTEVAGAVVADAGAGSAGTGLVREWEAEKVQSQSTRDIRTVVTFWEM